MKNKKKHGVGYYAKKVVMIERHRDLEENIIRLLWDILAKYYTRKWERWYD